MSSIDQQFVEFVVKSIVSKPDKVSIERRIDEKGVLLELTVNPEDLGRVIGKRGATAQSLRTLLRALGTKNDARYNLKIVDNGFPSHAGYDDNAQAVPAAAPVDDATDDDDDHGNDHDDDQHDTHDEPKEPQEDTEKELPAEEPESDVISKTRQELEELDDLDV
jgi:predicted RNA-binding protein YlqC (UPF0109 family)